MSGTDEGAAAESPPARIRVAQALALLALAAALVGAVGPADKVQTTYSWPPTALPASTPESAWYTPLLLARHRAAAISAVVPCALPPPLPSAASPTTVLATARNPEHANGLAVMRAGDRLEVTVGDRFVDRIGLSPTRLDGSDCAYRLRLAGQRWSLVGGPDDVNRSGELRSDPTVTGLFSALDLRAPGAPSIEVTTAVHATRTTTLQAVAWATAGLAALGALLLVSLAGRGRRPQTLAPWAFLRRAFAALRAPDAGVAAFLLVWWVISPAYFDDGWVLARERTFEESGGFSLFYSTFGVNLPLDYWVEWLHHWLAESTSSLLVNRVPSLVCLAAIWVLCRFIAARTLGPSVARAPMLLWTLAAAFAIGTAAWGMTLRPEPVTALLVTGVAACMVVFLARESTVAVAGAAALVALALSAHPAGIVSLAPVVVAAPRLVRWVRPNIASATAVVAAALALLSTLVFVGADLEQRRADAQVIRTFSYNEGWRDELTRYSLLDVHQHGTTLRRVDVALMMLAIFAYLLRRRRDRQGLLDVPVWALTAGLVLLVATPSKWPSHFGTLLGIAAVAVCCETARLRNEAAQARRWRAWPFAAIGAASFAVSWAWLVREQWNAVDLRTLDWSPGFESWLPVARLAAALPIIVLVGWLLLARFRARTTDRQRIPWRVASWTGLLVTLPVLVFTAGMLVADTAQTSSWTLGRQSLGTLAGRDPGCGLADALLVPALSSARPLPTAVTDGRGSPPEWVPVPPVATLPRFALGPALPGDSKATPWFALPADGEFGLFVTGTPRWSDRLQLEWGRREGSTGDFSRLGAEAVALDVGPMGGDTPWRFLTASELAEPDPDATAVRVALDAGVGPSGAIAVTAPVTYERERLADLIRSSASPTLVLPNLFTYFPCVDQPVLANGVVEVPGLVLSWRNQSSALYGRGTSPFEGIHDLYDLERLSPADSDPPPRDVYAYRVDRRIPGAIRVPPTATTLTS